MQKKPKFLIAAPSYDNRSGGCMVLHQLCHLLNNITTAYVYTYADGPHSKLVKSWGY